MLFRNNSVFLLETNKYKNMPTLKKRSKEELIEAFKKAIDKKKQWEEEAQREFIDMRNNQIQIQ